MVGFRAVTETSVVSQFEFSTGLIKASSCDTKSIDIKSRPERSTERPRDLAARSEGGARKTEEGKMTDLQKQLLDTGLRYVQDPDMQPNEVPWSLHPILAQWYARIHTHELGRRIVIDAIARAGFFDSDQ
jgi:hypothetical protein